MGFFSSLGDTLYAFLFGLVAGFLVELFAIFATIQLSKIMDRAKVSKDKRQVIAEEVKVVESAPPARIVTQEKPIPLPNKVVSPPVVAPQPSAQFGQRFWYFVQGHEKPFTSLREVLSLFPVEYAKYGKSNRLTWDILPKDVQSLIHREEIVRKK
jgi:hypothetical protein